MTLETLSIRFVAEVGQARGQIMGLVQDLRVLDAQASRAYNAGLQLSQGLARGIRAGKSGVVNAAKDVANAAVRAIRQLLQIRSPSRVAIEMGGRLSEGFALGILRDAGETYRAAGRLSSGAARGLEGVRTEGLSGSVQKALEEFEMVVPLNVDGVKLGEAAIRGINAVTAASGRFGIRI